uniref:Uncharacterized protein n=1 Tax=Rhizophora mucronata TaxID=61149 RepID=A0A2P2N3N9_RHIMU
MMGDLRVHELLGFPALCMISNVFKKIF